MKIAMIGHKRIPSREGGIEIVVEELAKQMVEKGHSVTVYNRKSRHVSGKSFDSEFHYNLKEYKGIHIIQVPTFRSRRFNALVYSFLATIHALFSRYDCIHYHAEGPCAMLLIPHLFGIRTVATIHGLDWKRAKWGGFATKYLKFGEKIAAKYADEVIVLSMNMKQYFLDEYERVTKFIPNGISMPNQKPTNLIEKEWGLKKDEYLLYLGRIVPEKGIQYLVDAYREVHTGKKLVIAGGSSHTASFMREIKKNAEEDDRIIFTDFVQGEILEELYSNAYLFVLPSDLEGMPISLLEAMSYGNCCVVSDIPECSEVVEDKAIIFKKNNVLDLKNKLNLLVQNPVLVNEYKRSASDFICKKFDWNDITKKTVQLYRK